MSNIINIAISITGIFCVFAVAIWLSEGDPVGDVKRGFRFAAPIVLVYGGIALCALIVLKILAMGVDPNAVNIGVECIRC